jgi:hypothetical protein
MTTARSPLPVLKAQADKIAAQLKVASEGKSIAHDPAGKIAAALAKESITFAVAMDDKILKIEMPWATIRETSEAGIAEFILDRMREERGVAGSA